MSECRFKRARERAGLSIAQASRLSGVPVDVIAAFEGDTVPNDENIARLVDIYGVNADWLMGRTDLRDYAAIAAMRGAEDLSWHDRDVLAEFVASMPRRKS